ncbi:MAG: FprA family A-type flavoprotein [Selenomonas sp.]|uniref:FprA family A-type flavoprotein n=1 Tax=Selenomonas sp. TaxID=2053611 RepID=UPI0025F6ACAB|nr:FprA family A-type flavoprotein [Selenomonas sp.]MCR5756937.1 FprA family A-type flavoprotein [Selenomonas sp.]
MQAIEIQQGIYWVGAIDWSMRSFHGYQTGRGSTYNAYLILDDKITLIDTVKETFASELLARVKSVIDPAQIDYIVSSHVEPDHSGAIPFMLSQCPKAKIITSLPNGEKGLKSHYGDLPYQGVKAGDSLSIGQRTLQFVPTPMLHWPDSMVTYCPEEKILFSNDAFGEHLASNQRFDDEVDKAALLYECQKYYANILMLYGRQAQTALKTLGGLDIKLIATGHGVIWRSYIQEIMNYYQKWSANSCEERAVIVFDSMWHSTEKMARAIAEGFAQKNIPVSFYDIKENHLSDIVTDILTAKYLAVGSPTINNQMMPTIASFLCYLKGLAPKDKKAFAFGSYGWGGQSIGLIEEELKAMGFTLILDKIRMMNIPSPAQLAEISRQLEKVL